MKTRNKPVIMIDFSGVYFREATEPLAKELSQKINMPEKKIRSIILGLDYTRYAEGLSTPRQYWKHIAAKLGISKRETKLIRRKWHNNCVPNKGMPQLVKKLREKYKVVAFSGNIKERVEHLNKRYDIGKEFHECHYSFHYGYDKPDVRLFRLAVRKMKARPENCIVVDDDKKFLAAVRKTGAQTILFRNARHLELQLREMGVEV